MRLTYLLYMYHRVALLESIAEGDNGNMTVGLCCEDIATNIYYIIRLFGVHWAIRKECHIARVLRSAILVGYI